MIEHYKHFLPEEQKHGRVGYYPVCNYDEWEELPIVYKAMEWFPVEVHKEKTVAEYVEFQVTYMEPYKINGTLKVHVQEFQKIMFCLFENPQCHLYSITGVIFRNGQRYPAKWLQDGITGAFEVVSCGMIVGKQGGFGGFVPNQIEEREDGFHWAGYKPNRNTCHVTLLNPFEKDRR